MKKWRPRRRLTHTAPPRPVTEAPPAGFGGMWGVPWPRHRHAAVSTRLPVFIAPNSAAAVDSVRINDGGEGAAFRRAASPLWKIIPEETLRRPS